MIIQYLKNPTVDLNITIGTWNATRSTEASLAASSQCSTLRGLIEAAWDSVTWYTFETVPTPATLASNNVDVLLLYNLSTEPDYSTGTAPFSTASVSSLSVAEQNNIYNWVDGGGAYFLLGSNANAAEGRLRQLMLDNNTVDANRRIFGRYPTSFPGLITTTLNLNFTPLMAEEDHPMLDGYFGQFAVAVTDFFMRHGREISSGQTDAAGTEMGGATQDGGMVGYDLNTWSATAGVCAYIGGMTNYFNSSSATPRANYALVLNNTLAWMKGIV